MLKHTPRNSSHYQWGVPLKPKMLFITVYCALSRKISSNQITSDWIEFFLDDEIEPGGTDRELISKVGHAFIAYGPYDS